LLDAQGVDGRVGQARPLVMISAPASASASALRNLET
jgi:hypothetical protein